MSEMIARSRFFNRVFDSFIPFSTWALITLPVWLSPFHPAVVSYFIIGFDLYFFYRSITTVYRATLSFTKIKEADKIAFEKKVIKLPRARKITHFIIIPNYKEPLNKLMLTVESIVKNNFPYKNLVLVLAFEKREEEAQEKAAALQNKFGSFFNRVICSYHELTDVEAPGKASNQTHSAKIVDAYVTENNLDRDDILITICDADSSLPKNYFSYLTYEYLRDKDRLYHFYWAPVLLYNNFWQLPFFVRVQATLSSMLRLAFLSEKDNLIQISTYSASLSLLKKINYWDVDIIPEDWHVYLQAFFKFGSRVKTMPLYTIVNSDAVYSGSLIKTLTNRYEQEKRWAWGVSDIGYAVRQFFITPGIDPVLKIKKILYISETHLLWPVSFFILTISASVPPLVNPVFKKTVLGFLLPKLSGLILTLASSLLIFYVYLDIKLRQKIAIQTRYRNLPMLLIQWYFLPIISFFLSSLPALESHTRMLLGKKIKYKVTEKV